MAAERLYPSLHALHRLILDEIGLGDVTHHFYVGDFEGFSEQNLIRIGVTATEFVAKVRGQRDTLQREAPVPVTVQLFSELCGGQLGWFKRVDNMRARMGTPEFEGVIGPGLIREIVNERRSLYRAWFLEDEYDEELLPMLVSFQAAEYATVGEVVASHFGWPLIVAAGSERLLAFYRLAARLPVLCLRATDI